MTTKQYDAAVMRGFERMMRYAQEIPTRDYRKMDERIAIEVISTSGILRGNVRRADLEGIALAAKTWQRNFDLTLRLREG